MSSLAKKMDSFSLRLFDMESDYPLMRKWWTGYGKKTPAKGMLSDTGLVVEYDRPVLMAWLYISNSKLAQIGFIVGDPEVYAGTKIAAISYMCQAAKDLLRRKGIEYVHCYSDQAGLTRALNASGFDILSSHDFLMLKLGEEPWE